MRKKFYKSKKDFIKVMVILSMCQFTVSAHEYVPIVKYDRVWESVTGEWGPYTVKYMKFDGTEEINGKTYHRIVTYKKSIMNWDAPSEAHYEYFDNICENEGYLREEDGKVYTLVIDYDFSDYSFGITYSPDEPDADNCKISERLLYDFNCNEDDEFNAFSCCMKTGEMMNFTVLSKSSMEIDGEKCQVINIYPSVYVNEYCKGYEVIEGIGPTDYGCLNYNEFYTQPTRPWLYNYFNRLFDADGNVIYKTKNCVDYQLPDDAFSSVNSISQMPTPLFSDGFISYGEDNHFNSIKVYSMNGSKVKSVGGRGRILILTNDLSTGVYMVVFDTDGKTSARRKFIVK